MSARTTNITSVSELAAARRQKEKQRVAGNHRVGALVSVVVVLLILGLAETISAASTVEIREGLARFTYLRRQLIGVGLGSIAMVVAARVRYQTYRRFAFPIYLGAVAALVLVLIIGTKAGGARAWLDLGPLSFQPSEIAKFAIIVTLATFLERKAPYLGDARQFLVPVGFLVGLVGALVMFQPDLGTLIVIAGAVMGVLITSPAPLGLVTVFGLGSAGLGTLLALADSERRSRLTSFLDPSSDLGDTGYQAMQSLYALANGGLFGTGLGNSRARWYYLPNAHTDFIFAIIGEETGLVGAMAVVAFFVLLTVVGWSIAATALDSYGRMLAAGITSWLSFQAVVNIGGVIGALPITGIPLPFVSYGGSSLVTSMAAVGVLINIARQTNLARS